MPDETPADKLARLKKELQDKQSNTSQLTKEIDQLKVQIGDLSKTVGDIDQKTSAYEKVASAASDQMKGLTVYVKGEKAKLKSALPASVVTETENKKKEAREMLKDLETKLVDATKKAVDAGKAYDTAKSDTTEAEVAYKAIAGEPASNAKAINDVTGLRMAAEKEGAANSLARQYFLILLMEDGLATINVLTHKDYKKQVNEAGEKLNSASDAQTTAKDTLNAAVAAQNQAQKILDDARAKWRQETLDKIPVTPSPAAPSAGARSNLG